MPCTNGLAGNRQKDYVDAEMGMGRAPEQVSAVVGYAGGKAQGTVSSGMHLAPSHPIKKFQHMPATMSCMMQGRRGRYATTTDQETPFMSG